MNQLIARLFSLILVALTCISTSFAQYTLPRCEVLKEANVREMRVYRTELRTVSPKGDSAELEEKRRGHLVTFFINERGCIDSLYNYPNDTGYYEKEVMTYDSSGRMIEYQKFDKRKMIAHQTIVTTDSGGGWFVRSFEYGKLQSETWATADSLIYEVKRYTWYDLNGAISTYSYDLENDIRSDTWYRDGVATGNRTYQWVAVDGVPDHFYYTEYELEEGKRPRNSRVHEFKMDEDGYVINERRGSVFDPFRMHDYYRRHDRFRGLDSSYHDYFKEDTLLNEKEATELWKFDGTYVVVLYEIEYEQW